jgi:hypothetical protein
MFQESHSKQRSDSHNRSAHLHKNVDSVAKLLILPVMASTDRAIVRGANAAISYGEQVVPF